MATKQGRSSQNLYFAAIFYHSLAPDVLNLCTSVCHLHFEVRMDSLRATKSRFLALLTSILTGNFKNYVVLFRFLLIFAQIIASRQNKPFHKWKSSSSTFTKGMVYAKKFLSAFSARPRKKKPPEATLNLPKHPLLNIKIKNSTCFNSQKEKIYTKMNIILP